MSTKLKSVNPKKVITVDPFTVEVYESDQVGFEGNKVVVTLPNRSVRYEFSQASQAYWFIIHIGADTDALKSYLTILTLTSDMLCNDDKFLSDISKIIDDAIKRKSDDGAKAAKEVTELDEDAAQKFMEGVAEEIDKRDKIG